MSIGLASQPMVSVAMTSPSGCSADNGSIRFTEQVATGSLLYSIDGGQTRSTTTEFTGLGAGAYAILVENDDAACPTVLDTTVVLAAAAQPVISAALVEDNPSCASRSGRISLEVTNATDATRYRINAGPWQSAPLFTGLNADDYTVEARDTVSGCTTVVDSLVTVPGRKLVPDFQVDTRDATDCNPPDGSVSVDLLGADATLFEYTFNGGLSYQTDSVRTGVSPGTLTVGVRYRDEPGSCTPVITRRLEGFGVNVAIDSVVATPRSCMDNNGAIAIFGAAGNLRYSLDTGATWTTDSLITGLEARLYLLTVGATDNACTVDYGPVRVNPTNLRIDYTLSRGNNCRDTGPADIELDVSGGRGGYTYAWSDGSTDSSRYDLPEGDYSVTVLDAFDCMATEEFTVRTTERDRILASIPDTAACLGDTIVFDLSNLGEANNYLWRGADNVTTQGPILRASLSGDYILTTTTPGCTFRDTFNVEIVAPADYAADFSLPRYGVVDEVIRWSDASRPAADSVNYFYAGEPVLSGGAERGYRLSFPQVGEYTVAMEAFSGMCYDTTEKRITIVERTTNLDTNAVFPTEVFQGLVLYPNPHNGDFNVKGTALRDIDANFRCYDDLGRLQFETTIAIPAGLFDVDLDARAVLPMGMQSIIIEAGDEEVILRHYRAER